MPGRWGLFATVLQGIYKAGGCSRENICVVKNTSLFPYPVDAWLGVCWGVSHFVPISCSKYISCPSSSWNCLLTEAACFLWLKVCLLFNQVKECLEVQSPEPTRLISNPGATTRMLCDPRQVCCGPLCVRFPFLYNRDDGGTYPMKKWEASKRYSHYTQNWALWIEPTLSSTFAVIIIINLHILTVCQWNFFIHPVNIDWGLTICWGSCCVLGCKESKFRTISLRHVWKVKIFPILSLIKTSH